MWIRNLKVIFIFSVYPIDGTLSYIGLDDLFQTSLVLYMNVSASDVSSIRIFYANDSLCYLASPEILPHSHLTVLEMQLYDDLRTSAGICDFNLNSESCIVNLTEPLPSCTDVSLGEYHIPVEFEVFLSLLNNFSEFRFCKSRLSESKHLINTISSLLAILFADTEFSLNGLSCDSANLSWTSSPNASASELVASLIIRIHQIIWKTTYCSNFTIQTDLLVADFLVSFPSDSCMQNQKTYFSNLFTGNTTQTAFPSLCVDPYLPEFTSLLPNHTFLNSTTRIIVIGSFQPSLLLNASLDGYVCPSTSSLTVVPRCEELDGVDACDINDACYIDWGPCQPTKLGFYSPAGVLGQIPCPNKLGVFERYVAESACKTECVSDTFVNSSSLLCEPVPIGFHLVACSSGQMLVPCVPVPGTVFLHPNSCLYRRIVLATGSYQTVLLPRMVVESWIQINTLILAQSVLLPILGSFGIFFLAVMSNNSTHFQIVLSLSNVLFYSDSLPHITQWTHIGVQRDGTEIEFFLNAKSCGKSFNSTISDSITGAVFVNEIFPSELLNRIHFGPLLLDASDIHNGSFLQTYVSAYNGILPSFALFDPQVRKSGSGFFRAAPPGLRENAPPLSTGRVRFDCRNFCAAKPYECLPNCIGEFAYNPATCLCESVATPATTTTSTIAVFETFFTTTTTSTVDAETLSTPATHSDTPSTESDALTSTTSTESDTLTTTETTTPTAVCETATDSLMYLFLLLALPLSVSMLMIRRRTQVIVPIGDNQIHAFPTDEFPFDLLDPFANVTVDYFEYYSRLLSSTVQTICHAIPISDLCSTAKGSTSDMPRHCYF